MRFTFKFLFFSILLNWNCFRAGFCLCAGVHAHAHTEEAGEQPQVLLRGHPPWFCLFLRKDPFVCYLQIPGLSGVQWVPGLACLLLPSSGMRFLAGLWKKTSERTMLAWQAFTTLSPQPLSWFLVGSLLFHRSKWFLYTGLGELVDSGRFWWIPLSFLIRHFIYRQVSLEFSFQSGCILCCCLA